MSVEVSLGIIAICMLVITTSALALAIVLLILALQIRKSVVRLTNRARPLIDQATELTKTANTIGQKVKVGTEDIVHKTEETVEGVAKKVRVTSDIIQEAINPPIITLASALTGIQRGIEVLTQMRRRGGNGHAG